MGHERPLSLLRAWILLVRVRLILWLLPWPSAERALARLNAPPARTPFSSILQFFNSSIPSAPEPLSSQLRWAVLAASRFIPASTCLVQALALQILLTRAGHVSDLRLGVASSSTDGVTAHAWLEYEGRVLIGERQETYAPLPLEGPLLGRSKASAISSYDRQRAS
jgi:hypothetical protein